MTGKIHHYNWSKIFSNYVAQSNYLVFQTKLLTALFKNNGFRKIPPGKIPTYQTPPWNIPTHFINCLSSLNTSRGRIQPAPLL